MLRPDLNPQLLTLGQTLPDKAQTYGEADLVAYGAATWDWHRLHYDQTYAKFMQLPSPPIDGQMFGAVFAREAMNWAGPKAFIQNMGLKMKSMAFVGEHLVAKGVVSSIDEELGVFVIELQQKLLCGERLVAEASTSIRLVAQ
jgi:acyl dehydratase